jgi:stage III sporulation protein AD
MIFKACAVALVAAVCAVVLGELGWRGRGAFGVVSAVIVLSFATDGLSEIGTALGSFSFVGELGELAEASMKIIGIGYVFGIGSDVCRELGEGAVASALNLVGRIEILLVTAPFFKEISELGLRLLEV